MTTWGAFAAAEPALAEFVTGRLLAAPSYLATVRDDGAPRVHPTEVRANAYGDVELPEPRRWRDHH